MARSVTEAWSHYEGRGGRSLTGVHRSVTGGGRNKNITGGHGNATSGNITLAGIYGFMVY